MEKACHRILSWFHPTHISPNIHFNDTCVSLSVCWVVCFMRNLKQNLNMFFFVLFPSYDACPAHLNFLTFVFLTLVTKNCEPPRQSFSSVLWRRVMLRKDTNDSEDHAASIFALNCWYPTTSLRGTVIEKTSTWIFIAMDVSKLACEPARLLIFQISC